MAKNFETLPVFTPISSTNSIVKSTPVLVEQKIVMASFAPEIKKNPRDILDLFDWQLVIYGGLVLLAILMFSRLWNSHHFIGQALRALKITLWTMVELISSQNFPPNLPGTSRILMTSLILFILFLVTILNSLISTDLVIGEKPFMLDRLEDVLDPRASKFRPVWRKVGGQYEMFSQSYSPIKRKIWEEAQKIGLDKCLLDNNVFLALNLANKYQSNPFVAFVYEMVMSFMKIHSCSELFPLGKRKVHIGSETAGIELLGFPYHFRNDTCKGRKQLAVETL